MEEKITKKKIHAKTHESALYVMGMIGAAVYFISQATGFWMGLVGFLKACVWPAFLVYQALEYFGK